MFFNRKTEDAASQRVGLTDGIEAKVADFVKDWGSLKRGNRQFVADRQEEPLKLLTDADVAYFVKAMDDEVAAIEAEIEDARKSHLALIAQKDAEIASLNREKESRIATLQAKVRDQESEIERRALALVDAVEMAKKIYPAFDAKDLRSALDVRREVVRRRCGDGAVDGKTEAYIDERFELLAARVNTDPFAVVMADGIRRNDPKDAAEKAYQESVQRLRDAHKQPPEN